MAVAHKTETAQRPRPTYISPLSIEAELACLMCGRTVGEVVNGRAIQHPGCPNKLRLERGLVRCCHCNGPVYREPLMAMAPR